MNKYKYKVSVIIPIYNVEKYLEETILSIVRQSIGFNNIQLILVNDGSPDNSEEICLRYVNLYPNNVVYLKKENSGVSDTRNYGMKYIEGKYVNFLDADDIWDKDAFEKGYNMLETNNDIDLVVFRMKRFEGKKDRHQLDYKFDGDYVVDLRKDYDKIQLSSCTILYRSKLFKKYFYDKTLRIAEDYKLVNEIILEKLKYGMISSSSYNYRVRGNASSAMQSLGNKKEDYIINVRNCHKKLIDKSIKLYGKVVEYLQYSLVYEIQWRLINSKVILTEEENIEYAKLLREIIGHCDDHIIIEQLSKSQNFIFKNLDFKYNELICKKIKIENNSICYKNKKIFDLEQLYATIFCLEINNNKLNVSCLFDIISGHDYNLYAKVNDSKYIKFDKIVVECKDNNLFTLANFYNTNYYDININLENVDSIELFVEIDGKKYPVSLKFDKHSKLNNCKYSYYKNNEFILTHKDSRIILVNQKTNFVVIKYLFELLFVKKEILSFGILFLYYLTYPFVKHDNWIVSDRYDVAGDSGEWLFKYIRANSKKSNVFFALKKNSKDINKMKSFGKVLKFNSVSYYLKYLNSEVVISSHVDGFIHKPYGRKQIFLNHVCNRKFVFLQHGITKDDVSSWLGKYNKNISMFICTAREEYNSLFNKTYMYDKDVVKLTGLPRYDNLLSGDIEEENLVALMPTWRSSLVGSVVAGTQDRGYNKSFVNSDYYKFYNGIINDKRIKKMLKDKNYKILFCLHPSMKGQIKDFKGNEFVNITYYVDYPTIFKKAKFMITDYSSVFFDFAFLNKPILYTQFDKNIIHKIHSVYTDSSYFDYERDAFGDVVYDCETAINKIVEIVNNGCKMDDKYKKRVDKFFKYKDNRNCERVYNEILKMLDKDKYEK